MKVRAVQKNARLSPRKARPIAAAVRGLSAGQADSQLQYMPGKAAGIILSTLRSAVANAVNNFQITKESLHVADIQVNKGMVLKRFSPAAKGVAHPILKRYSHITVTVDGQVPKRAGQAKKPAAITTLTTDQFAVQTHEKEPLDSPAPEAKAKIPPDKARAPRAVETVQSKAEYEAFQKMKMQQQGGDKKKTHRRKSIG